MVCHRVRESVSQECVIGKEGVRELGIEGFSQQRPGLSSIALPVFMVYCTLKQITCCRVM